MKRINANILGRDCFEVAAYSYLCARFGKDNVSHEPNERYTFPDYIVSQHVIYEVTRLTNPIPGEGKKESYENLGFKLIQVCTAAIDRFQKKRSWKIGVSKDFWIDFDLELDRLPSPLDFHALKLGVQSRLRCILETLDYSAFGLEEKREELIEGVTLNIYPGVNNDTGPRLKFIGYQASHGTAAVVPNLIDAINFSLGKKNPKLEGYEHPYTEAWLVVGGGSSLGFELADGVAILDGIKCKGDWSGVVLLNHLKPENSVELRFPLEQ